MEELTESCLTGRSELISLKQSIAFLNECLGLQDVETKSEAKTDGLDGTEGSGEDDFDQYLNALNDNNSSGMQRYHQCQICSHTQLEVTHDFIGGRSCMSRGPLCCIPIKMSAYH